MKIAFFIGLFGVFITQVVNAQTMNLLCNGIVTRYEVDENVIPYKRILKAEYKSKKTYVIKNGKLDLFPIKECSVDEEKIFCKGGIKDISNPNIDRNLFVTFNRLSGEVFEEDFTQSGFKKELFFEGQCVKASQKF